MTYRVHITPLRGAMYSQANISKENNISQIYDSFYIVCGDKMIIIEKVKNITKQKIKVTRAPDNRCI